MSLRVIQDSTVDNTDKSFTVGAGLMQKILWLLVTLATTATAGNRNIRLEIQDGASAVQFRMDSGAVQAASLTNRHAFFPGAPRGSSFVNSQIEVPIPPSLVLLPGWKVRVYDSAAIAPAADDMTINLAVNEFQQGGIRAEDMALL